MGNNYSNGLGEGGFALSSSERYVIAQVSDIHCGDPRFDAHLAEKVVRIVHEAEPDLVLVPGDLTAFGYPEEFEEAEALLSRLPSPCFVVPGNHDERNVGWRIYERMFGPRWHHHTLPFGVASQERACDTLALVCCDSAEPDLDTGELGRVRHKWISDSFDASPSAFRIAMLHHHLLAVPNTGRERNTVADSGDVLATLSDCDVDLVLSGHKHVPHAWMVDGIAVVTSGTATSWRIRGEVPPSMNIIVITPTHIEIKVIWTSGQEPFTRLLPRRL